MSAKYIKPKNITSSKLTKLTIIGHGNTISGLKYSTAVGYTSAIKSRATIIRKKTLAIGLISYIDRPLLIEGLNLRVNSPKIETSANAFGALIGTVSSEGATISKCGIYGTIECTKITNNLGGLIGSMSNGGSINNCWSYCTIKSYDQNNRIGGLVGYLSCSSVYNCGKFEGEIVSTSGSTIGGLFGYANSVTSYDKCFNQARLESTDGCVGGIIGELANESVSINDCYNNANLSCNNGSIIGGLVGSGKSGLTFNRCYSNGELKRSDYSTTFSSSSDDNYKDIGSYNLNNNYSSYDSYWKISYSNAIDIQNSGGESNSTISLGVYKVENKTGTNSIVTANLCGTVATYNSSFCRNTYTIGGTTSVSGVESLKIYFRLSCDGNNHNAGTKIFYGSSVSSGYYSLNDMVTGYLFDFGSNKDLINKIPKVSDMWYSGVYESLQMLWLKGIYYSVSGTKMTIYPYLGYTIHRNSGDPYEGSITDTSKSISISFSLPSVTTTNNASIVTSTSSISLSTLGSAFTTASGRNGNLPILKDFYWEYN
jgi:hypothetical protein